MNKKLLVEKIEQKYGIFLMRKEVAELLNMKDPKAIDPMLKDLSKVKGRYFSEDIADAIMREQSW